MRFKSQWKIKDILHKNIHRVYSSDVLQEKHVCLNCGNEFVGAYCNVCGQSAAVQRINRHSVFRNMFSGFLQLDNSFLYTICALFVRPGSFLRGYLKGKRADCIHPFQLLFLLATLYAMLIFIIAPKTGQSPGGSGFEVSFNNDAIYKNIVAYMNSNAFTAFLYRIFLFLKDNIAFTSIALMPLYALATRWAFHKNIGTYYDFNFMELIVVRAYMSCMLIIVVIIGLFFNNETHALFNVIITFWVYLQLFGERKKRTFWHVLLMYFYMCLMLIAIAIVLGLLAVVLTDFKSIVE